MKHLKIFFPAVFLIVTLFLTVSSAAEKPIKIGIMKFNVAQKLDPGLGDFLYNSFLEQMINSGKYSVVDWEGITRVLGSVKKSQPNISKEDAKKQALNQLGIQKMYIGSLNSVAEKFNVSVKVLNQDFTVERIIRLSTAGEDGLEECINKLATDLLLSRKEIEANKAEKATAAASKKKEEKIRRWLENRKGKETGRDGSFVAFSRGIVVDTSTGLMWASRDNGNNISWEAAKQYCENFNRSGYSDWRLPTQDELAELYDPGRKNGYGYHVTKLIDISACCPWAS